MKARGHPILGAISGFIFGGLVAVDLAQFSVMPLDNLSVIGFPVIGAVLGILLGMWGPLRRSRTSTPATSEDTPTI